MKKIYLIVLLTVSLVSFSGFTLEENNYFGNADGQTKVTRFYPNPAISFINFEFQHPLEKGHTLQIFSFIGNKVTEIAVSGSKVTLTLDGYFRGVYCFRLSDKSGKIIDSGKFQVVK